MDAILQAKQDALDRRLRNLGSVLVAYSGGVDSAYLAWRAHEVLGGEMRAVVADSLSLARRHFRDALHFAERHGIPVEIIRTAELENPEYAKNDLSRCFHCKNELFKWMHAARQRLGHGDDGRLDQSRDDGRQRTFHSAHTMMARALVSARRWASRR